MSTRHASPFSTLSASVAQFAHAVLSLKTVWQRRRVIGQLGALDDHMLRDIGITRQDVLSVMAEPLYRDPSEKLAERAHETRSANRANARANWPVISDLNRKRGSDTVRRAA